MPTRSPLKLTRRIEHGSPPVLGQDLVNGSRAGLPCLYQTVRWPVNNLTQKVPRKITRPRPLRTGCDEPEKFSGTGFAWTAWWIAGTLKIAGGGGICGTLAAS